ncbi:MAG: hypothetical protein ACU843_15035 [Gammaproteobacteria bacterium]
MSLPYHRRKLWSCLTSFSAYSWNEVKPLIENWWEAYKNWETTDNFNDAFTADRMSVRTFGAGFESQLVKSIGLTGPLNLDIDEKGNRFFKDSRYTPVPQEGRERIKASGLYKREANAARESFQPTSGPGSVKVPGAYWANRALDSEVFANPDNFATRESKYDWGLHDLSASLLNHNLSIFEQIHNTEQGAHFSFMPLAEPEDQRTIYTLIQMAKTMKPYWPEMYALIRKYRARMTRIKLAQNFDMGVGYIAIPVTNPGPNDRKFKLRYGLVNNLTVPESVDPSKSIKVTPEVYHGRQQAALNYRSILDRVGKNEIVIALRQHNGKFPVYAERKGNELACYKIVGGNQVFDGSKISEGGVLR